MEAKFEVDEVTRSLNWMAILPFVILAILSLILLRIFFTTKICPHCKERITQKATVCRHCGKD